MPGVAARDPAKAEPGSLQGAIPLDRFLGIGRATRGEAALAAPPGAQQEAIPANEREEKARHFGGFAQRSSIKPRISVITSPSVRGSYRSRSRTIRSSPARL